MSTLQLPDIGLRPGNSRTLDDIMQVMEEAFDPDFGEAWSRAQCQAILGRDGVWSTLAWVGNRVAGFALARLIVDEGELLLLGVRPCFRRMGVGRLLLRHTGAEAAERGATKLHLEVRDGNSAGELYESEGFLPIGRRRDYYRSRNHGTCDAITLALPLGRRKYDHPKLG
ncbi:MAG: GNAT family N-acetyltransferase [Parasphingopyxis sp.]|nr:GNAT family N-acetyltransferase [Sphingomonadales bacterium]